MFTDNQDLHCLCAPVCLHMRARVCLNTHVYTTSDISVYLGVVLECFLSFGISFM
jgi:Sec-independent protein secretion pathway component TatC